ncbi:DUF6442 family protein [Peptostreptococcus porci]|uniref:DUF6442 family protein n=1 Tax=Peptostreptococcus porci TaxID=2652282 RepID=UPI002A91E8FE|nr:DUF6442 family protein [Peptostreptococcus porci]MDY5436808.1 DUF6442 family protein [Peptostreptococcus porci]MDY6231578.1 DUF6442 family protein [Peptostreptococcus porci]
MNKEEILSRSRKELKNSDLVEMQTSYQAGNIAGRVGATMCILISVIARILTDEYIVSPWIIYFSILGTNWLVRFIKLKRKTDLLVSLIFIALAIVLFIVQVKQLTGANV